MPLFVARQPILDVSNDTYAYELLFRSGIEQNAFSHNDGDQASLAVMNTGFFELGLQKLTSGKKAFVNCTRRLLLEGFPELLPRESVVIEILEDIVPDEEIVEACYRLKAMGYSLALDDFKYTDEYQELIPAVDYIKVDFRESSPDECREMAETLAPLGISLLAEKVETQKEADRAKELGYLFFQGYFFSRPTILESESMHASKVATMHLLSEVQNPDFDINRAEGILKHDPVLAVRLLRYINSAAFGVRREIDSIRQAMALLGQRNMRKWLTMLALSSLTEEKPAELLRQSVVRARFCELLGELPEFKNRGEELFLTGMFSLLGAMANQPIEKLLPEMALPESVKSALLEHSGRLYDGLALAQAFEEADWSNISQFAERYNADADKLASWQQDAYLWADELVPSI